MNTRAKVRAVGGEFAFPPRYPRP